MSAADDKAPPSLHRRPHESGVHVAIDNAAIDETSHPWPEPQGNVRGAVIRDYLEWVWSNGGASYVREGYATLAPNEQRLFSLDRPGLGVIASNWYPQAITAKLTEPFWSSLSVPARRAGLRQVARFTVDQSLRGVQKMAFNLLMTPERAAKHMGSIWDRQYDNGSVEWNLIRPGEMRAVLSNFRSHTPWTCEMLLQVEAYLIERMGCRGVRAIRTQCIHHGGMRCESLTTWTP